MLTYYIVTLKARLFRMMYVFVWFDIYLCSCSIHLCSCCLFFLPFSMLTKVLLSLVTPFLPVFYFAFHLLCVHPNLHLKAPLIFLPTSLSHGWRWRFVFLLSRHFFFFFTQKPLRKKSRDPKRESEWINPVNGLEDLVLNEGPLGSAAS